MKKIISAIVLFFLLVPLSAQDLSAAFFVSQTTNVTYSDAYSRIAPGVSLGAEAEAGNWEAQAAISAGMLIGVAYGFGLAIDYAVPIGAYRPAIGIGACLRYGQTVLHGVSLAGFTDVSPWRLDAFIRVVPLAFRFERIEFRALCIDVGTDVLGFFRSLSIDLTLLSLTFPWPGGGSDAG